VTWTNRAEGGGRIGLWLVRTFASIMGRGPARLALYPITLYFMWRRAPERRASRDYLSRVLGRAPTFRDVFRHEYTFAATVLDRYFMLCEQFRRFEIKTFGLEDLHAAHDLERGVLLVGSHLGSFESLRVLSLARPDITVRVVLDVGHNRAITEVLDALNPRVAATVIDGGRDGTSIVLAIKDAVETGAIVTLLGDRTRPGDPSIPAQLLGANAEMPTSPWLIAAALKVPVVLAFGLYRGGNRYDLHFEPFAESLAIDRRRRAVALAEIVQRYADRLSHYARLAPYNWFNFYDFWQQDTPVEAIRAGDAGAALPVDGARNVGAEAGR
jgi:predicted LPLAT superfamily acyltransferase